MVIGFLIILVISCENDIVFEFGEVQNNFVQDSVYKTSSDGFLLVQIRTANAMTELGAIIYAGNNENPVDTIGIIEPLLL